MNKTSVPYDSAIIQKFADRLYKQAASIIATYTVVGVFLGLGLGALLLLAAKAKLNADIVTVIAAVAGGIIGYSRGTERAFSLRLQAQTALCQAQIEQNTRGAPRAIPK